MVESPAPPAGCLNHRYDRVTSASVPDTGRNSRCRSEVRNAGYVIAMTTSHDPSDQERIESRAHLLPEEAAAGSDDAQAQADAILAESDIREADQNAAPDTVLEHRTSEQTVTPVEPPD